METSAGRDPRSSVAPMPLLPIPAASLPAGFTGAAGELAGQDPGRRRLHGSARPSTPQPHRFSRLRKPWQLWLRPFRTTATRATACGRRMRKVLWHDEQNLGHHFPCGQLRDGGLEKAVQCPPGCRSGHVANKSRMARVADAVRMKEPGIHLVVFNPLPYERSRQVNTPLRRSTTAAAPWAVIRPITGSTCAIPLARSLARQTAADIVAGCIDLIDTVTEEKLRFTS